MHQLESSKANVSQPAVHSGSNISSMSLDLLGHSTGLISSKVTQVIHQAQIRYRGSTSRLQAYEHSTPLNQSPAPTQGTQQVTPSPALPLQISLWFPLLQGSHHQCQEYASCGPARHQFQTQAELLRWTEHRPGGQDSRCQHENWEGRNSICLHTNPNFIPASGDLGWTNGTVYLCY